MNRGQRKVGLDKPCQLCGKPIYYAYQGPYEGVCGRCTDRMKRKPNRRLRPNGSAQGSGGAGRRLAVIVLLAFLAGAAVMYLGHHHVLELIRGLFR